MLQFEIKGHVVGGGAAQEEGPDHGKQPCKLFPVPCPKGMGAHLKGCKQKFTGSDLCGQLSGVGIADWREREY